jgi:hypothetical protein
MIHARENLAFSASLFGSAIALSGLLEAETQSRSLERPFQPHPQPALSIQDESATFLTSMAPASRVSILISYISQTIGAG